MKLLVALCIRLLLLSVLLCPVLARLKHDPAFAQTKITTGARKTLLARSNSSLVQGSGVHDGPAPRVLFIVYSDSRFYETRLKWVTNTWARKIPPESLIIIGDAAYNGTNQLRARRIVPTRCPAHSHWEGACCKYAEAVLHALNVMRQDSSYEWAYFTDDDAYVRTSSIEQALLQQPEPAGSGLVLGNLGCSTKQCVGICAGGGYAANRRAVEVAVSGAAGGKGSNASEAFLAEQMQSCGQCERWADVALTQLYKRRGVELRPLNGLYGWRLEKAKFDESLSAPVEPLMYHYVQSERQMEFLDSLFGNDSAPSSQTQIGSPDEQAQWCAEFHGRSQCSSPGVKEDVPWGPMMLQTYSRWRPLPRLARRLHQRR